MPDTEALRRLNAQTEKLFPLINVFFSNGDIAVSTRPVKGWCFKHKRHAPEFFACLKSARPFRGGLEISHTIEVNRPFERENALLSRAGSLLDLFGKSEAFRLPVRSFFALFWETGRAVLLANQAQSPLVEVPATSLQIVDALARQTPNEAAVLRQIHSEYWKEARGEESEVERYMYWAGRYALLLNERLFSSGSNKERLPKEARTQLTISVTIVTRNRAPLLKRALESLVEQERAPDQVIVVDNASTDETREMVCAFAGRLKISIIPECRIGIPIARNTALMHCTGDIVALLDDDCVADRRWLAEIEKPFLRDPHIAAVGGRLTPVEGRSGLITRFYDSRMRDAAAAEALNER